MFIKKTTLIGSAVSAALILGGCQTISLDDHEKELAQQRAQYEQKIQTLETQNASANAANGDVSEQLFPPNAKPGRCYSRVLVPAIYTDKIEQVLVKPESKIVSIAPAQYEPASERILVKEESSKIIAVPATYKTITEQVEIRPAHTHLKTIPAVYETITERVVDKPAHTAWKRGEGFKSSALETRIDNGTGEVMCLVEVPATYKTITKTVLKTAKQTIEEQHPAEYKLVKRRVVDTPATTKTVVIPAEYKVVNVERLVTPEKEVVENVPAVYKEVSSSQKTSDEYLKWAEVLCEDNMTNGTVSKLQELLRDAGKYDGPIDGNYGPLTERAANSYAKSNNLPTGSRLISLETAKHIGLDI